LTATTRRLRSLLTVPANRADLVAKAPRSAPDAVFLDLEDGVPPAAKVGARADALTAAVSLRETAPAMQLFVRVNGLTTPWFEGDMAEALDPRLTGVVVPKVESADDVAVIVDALASADRTDLGILVGLESAAGVARAEDILGAAARWCYFGAEDFVADMGGTRTTGNQEVLYARSRVALAARLGGVHALDQIVTDFRDDGRYVHEAEEGRALGYRGKICIHPAQVPLANEVFTPSAAAVDHARRLLAAYGAAATRGEATIAFEGEMVDEPMARRARAVLAAADES
jgi:citrate lyase subunit beta / citryl-CoA lyase